MRSTALFLGAMLGTFLAAYGYTLAVKLDELAAENAELRLRDSARARVKGFKKGTVDVDLEAVHVAGYNLGTPPVLLEAVRRQENGSPLWEYGHQGKSEWIALGVRPDQWQAHEAARTLNKAAWKWILEDKARTREAVKALGIAYTAPHHAKTWARNVTKLMGDK